MSTLLVQSKGIKCYVMVFVSEHSIGVYDVPLDKRVDSKSKFRQLVKPYHVEGGIVKHCDKEV